MCSALHDSFSHELRCEDVVTSFIRPAILSERFAHVASFQYYQELPTLQHFADYISRESCPTIANVRKRHACEQFAKSLPDAVAFDVDFDALSQAITVTAIWSQLSAGSDATSQELSETQIHRIDSNDRVEVGVLMSEKADEPEELKLGGYLAVLGEDAKPGKDYVECRVIC